MGTPPEGTAPPSSPTSVLRRSLAVALGIVSALGTAALVYGLTMYVASGHDDRPWRELGLLIGLVIVAFGFSVALAAGLLAIVAWPRRPSAAALGRVPDRSGSDRGVARGLTVAAAVMAVAAVVAGGLAVLAASGSSSSFDDDVAVYFWLLMAAMAGTLMLVLWAFARAAKVPAPRADGQRPRFRRTRGAASR